jgi:hypothetical protein
VPRRSTAPQQTGYVRSKCQTLVRRNGTSRLGPQTCSEIYGFLLGVIIYFFVLCCTFSLLEMLLGFICTPAVAMGPRRHGAPNNTKGVALIPKFTDHSFWTMVYAGPLAAVQMGQVRLCAAPGAAPCLRLPVCANERRLGHILQPFRPIAACDFA